MQWTGQARFDSLCPGDCNPSQKTWSSEVSHGVAQSVLKCLKTRLVPEEIREMAALSSPFSEEALRHKKGHRYHVTSPFSDIFKTQGTIIFTCLKFCSVYDPKNPNLINRFVCLYGESRSLTGQIEAGRGGCVPVWLSKLSIRATIPGRFGAPPEPDPGTQCLSSSIAITTPLLPQAITADYDPGYGSTLVGDGVRLGFKSNQRRSTKTAAPWRLRDSYGVTDYEALP
ncbi:hypothetical protein RRG08_038704 [Elysia crispata]|uniref:Uncharacterized protein n=1 Tax=Elysia crispata TaxID=231223 RepID=A0AAE0ZIY6_9GAST|nr:hypothetical protein RRG08_038704 [Elysia crispata]